MASSSQTSGNYIHDLQMAVRAQNQTISEIRDCYQDLVAYLCSSKFHEDPTVQVQDVMNRLAVIRYSLMDSDNQIVNRLCKPVIATGEITSL